MKIPVLLLFAWIGVSSVFGQWELVWNDEFNYEGLPDTTKWGYDVGTGSNGWGNQELQYYTKDSLRNARVEKGTLIITAEKEAINGSNYSSARLVSRKKGDWLYGRFEIAAKLPKGIGLWPAIWMLPTDWEYGNWPASGELDIMENVGFDSMNVHFNIHTQAYNHILGTNKGAAITLVDPHTTFNVYALEWYEDSVVFFENNSKVFMFKNEKTGFATWPFDKRFHLILNIAVGGSWGGLQGVDDAIFPKSMSIDYVRVYKKSSVATHKSIISPIEKSPEFFVYGNRVVVTGTGVRDITLYTTNGRKIFHSTLQENQNKIVLPANIPKGIYCVHSTMSDGSIVKNILKESDF